MRDIDGDSVFDVMRKVGPKQEETYILYHNTWIEVGWHRMTRITEGSVTATADGAEYVWKEHAWELQKPGEEKASGTATTRELVQAPAIAAENGKTPRESHNGKLIEYDLTADANGALASATVVLRAEPEKRRFAEPGAQAVWYPDSRSTR